MVGSPWRALLPVPDGDVEKSDRYHVDFMYSGIVTPETVPNAPGLEYTMPESRFHFVLEEDRVHYTQPENRLHYSQSDNEP